MDALLAQRERVFLHDAGGRVPVLTTGRLECGAECCEVFLETRHGGSVSFSGRLLTHWVLGREDCPVTLREEPGDLVLDEVLEGGRVAVRMFLPNGAGVLLLLGVTLAQHELDNEMAAALGYAPVWS